jgi:hypothetical protein
MSQSDWYHDRAAECDRKAGDSRNPVTRSRHIKDRESWRAIADNIDAEEKAAKQTKAKDKSRNSSSCGSSLATRLAQSLRFKIRHRLVARRLKWVAN